MNRKEIAILLLASFALTGTFKAGVLWEKRNDRPPVTVVQMLHPEYSIQANETAYRFGFSDAIDECVYGERWLSGLKPEPRCPVPYKLGG